MPSNGSNGNYSNIIKTNILRHCKGQTTETFKKTHKTLCLRYERNLIDYTSVCKGNNNNDKPNNLLYKIMNVNECSKNNSL